MVLPRILVSSVDPWSEHVGSDTLSFLLSQFDSANVASINIRAQRSDSVVAGHYFHIVEGRVIKSILHPSVKTGEAYTVGDALGEEDIAEGQEENKRYGKQRRLNRYFYVLIRDLLWKLGHWKSCELDDFVGEFHPDVFLFPIEGYIHFNRLNRYIIETFKPEKVIGYMWDDNFTYKQHPGDLLYLIHRNWLRRSVKWLVEHCGVVCAITPKLKRELDAEYGIDSVLLTKPIRSMAAFKAYEVSSPIRIIYTGKLIIGRDETIATVVDAIRNVNTNGQKVVLDVYSGTSLTEEMRKRIAVEGCCRMHDFIPQQQVLEEQGKADVLLFAESLTNNNLAARLSFSTKITDYLSAGKCIWAVGHEELSPIDYLKSEDAALVSETKESVIVTLQRIVNEKNVIQDYALKAHNCGRKNHDKEEMFTKFKNLIVGSKM